MPRHAKYPYIDDFVDNEVYVFSTIGQGPVGPKGEKGDVMYPSFADPIDWDKGTDYPANTVVLYEGASYLSKQAVPHGIEITDTRYWALTNNYNAQVEACRQEVSALSDEIEKLKASVIVDTYADMYETTADNVVVLHNDSPYGDDGICFFEKTSFSNGTSLRADGSHMTPIPRQTDMRSGVAPMDSIMRCAETYIGNNALVYGNSNTLFNDTVTNEIDCSTFVQALMEGITYENSRYVRGSSSNNITGDYIGETFTPIQGVPRMYTWLMARYFLEHKCFYKFTGDAENDISKIKAGDILFSSSRTVTSENRLYDIDHCMVVLDVFPSDGTVLIMQGGAAPSTITVMQNTVCKLALVDFLNGDTPDDFDNPSFIGFARISYGAGSVSSNTDVVQNIESNGLVSVVDAPQEVILGRLKTKQAILPLTAYTVTIEGILPKFDIDGCWLILSIIASDTQFYNLARWYHMTISDNIARMTFVTPDFGSNTVTDMRIRVITENKTEYATAYQINKISLYRGYSTSEARSYALTYDKTNLSSDITVNEGRFSINEDGSLNASVRCIYTGTSTSSAADIILGSIGGCPYITNYNYLRTYGVAGRTTICIFSFDANGTVRVTVPNGISNGQTIYMQTLSIPREV